MSSNPVAFIETHFGSLRDPRAAHSIDHKLLDILVITICATISGADIAFFIMMRYVFEDRRMGRKVHHNNSNE